MAAITAVALVMGMMVSLGQLQETPAADWVKVAEAISSRFSLEKCSVRVDLLNRPASMQVAYLTKADSKFDTTAQNAEMESVAQFAVGNYKGKDLYMIENVLVTRTFSKAYGLAGFRVGYAVGPAEIAAALRAVSLPFGVSAVAQAAAVASLAAEAELLERVDALVAERDRVVTGLRGVGREVPEPQGNFVWFEMGERTAELAAAGDELGIVVRPFAGEGARITIGEDASTSERPPMPAEATS